MFPSQIMASENTALLQFVKLTECSTTNKRIITSCRFRLTQRIRRSDPCLRKRVGKNRSGYTTAAGMLWANCTAFRIGTTSPYRCGERSCGRRLSRKSVCDSFQSFQQHFSNCGDCIAQLMCQNILYPTIK